MNKTGSFEPAVMEGAYLKILRLQHACNLLPLLTLLLN